MPVADRVDPEELAEFVDVCAGINYQTLLQAQLTLVHCLRNLQFLPRKLQTLSYAAVQHDPALAKLYVTEDPDAPFDRGLLDSICTVTPVAVTDSLSVYGLTPDAADFPEFIAPVLTEYITSVTSGPPAWASTRADACEICDRDWIPLSYHHLIPRGVHAKVIKKGWHDEWMLNSVAWLCRACHSFVHRMATNEELAREYYTVDLILEREDVQDWARWVSRVRWKAT